MTSDHAHRLRLWADALGAKTNREMTVDQIAQVSGDDLCGDLLAAAREIEGLIRLRDGLVDIMRQINPYAQTQTDDGRPSP